MYKRKIEEYLVAWKNKDKRKPLIIKGVRQLPCVLASVILSSPPNFNLSNEITNEQW